jgi:hypothetical protein
MKDLERLPTIAQAPGRSFSEENFPPPKPEGLAAITFIVRQLATHVRKKGTMNQVLLSSGEQAETWSRR